MSGVSGSRVLKRAIIYISPSTQVSVHQEFERVLKTYPEEVMILNIVEAVVCEPHSLALTFNDGSRKRVNVLPLLYGPIFEPLREPEYFARVVVDPVLGTVVWPNEADFAPEALYELPAEVEESEPVG